MNTRSRPSVSRGDKKYEDFVKNLRLIVIGLISSSSEFDHRAYMKMFREKGAKTRKAISSSYKLEHLEKEFFDSSAKFTLAMEDEKTNADLVQIECVFLGHFHGKSPLEKGLAERFTDSEFRLIVWPYFRQFAHDLSARMSIPPILIPLSADQ